MNNIEKMKPERSKVNDMIYDLMHTPLSEKQVKELKKKGIELEDKHYTLYLLQVLDQVEKNNVKAFEFITGIMKQNEVENTRQNYELPARLIARSFVDINRSITNREYREYLMGGSRGSTKSSFVAEKITEIIKNSPSIHALVTRPYANTLRDSVYAQFVWAIEEMGDTPNWKFTTSPMELTYLPTGQKVFFRGGDEPEKIKSIKTQFGYIGILWFEEVDQFRGEEQIRNIEQSALRGGEIATVFKTYNVPRSRAHWINKYSKLDKPNMLYHHSTYLDVPVEWLGQPFFDEAELLKELNPKAYEHEYLGLEVGDGGNVFDNVVAETITDAMIDNFDYRYHGQDWGWYPDPNVLVAMSYDANHRILYIFDEEVGNKVKNEDWAVRIARFKDWTIVADSAEMKSINDFNSYGFNMRGAIKGPGSVHTGIKWLAGLNKIVIDPHRCPQTFKEFVQYEYMRDKEGNPITDYPDKNNHTIDSVRYAMEVVNRQGGL